MASHNTLETEYPVTADSKPASPVDVTVVEAQARVLQDNSQHERRLEEIQNLLRSALNSKHAIDWETFKRTDSYSEPEPPAPVYLEYLPEPQASDAGYQVRVDPSAPDAEQKKREAYEQYASDYRAWADAVKRTELENQKRYAEGSAAVEEWNRACQKHRESREAYNAAIDGRKAEYHGLQPEAVKDYCCQVLCASGFPEGFSRQFDLHYVRESKTLVVDHSLPAPSELPRVKGVKYLKTRGALVEVPLSDTAFNRLYAHVLYQICLRTLYELFDADAANALDAIAFNGCVRSTGPAGDPGAKTCVMSVQAGKQQFRALNLWDTDAKACFKALKGASNAKLHTLTPVTPVLNISGQPAGAPPTVASTSQTWTE